MIDGCTYVFGLGQYTRFLDSQSSRFTLRVHTALPSSCGSNKEDQFESEHGTMYLKRHVSFVDCPGHDILMATMLNGAAVMDAALLLIGELLLSRTTTTVTHSYTPACSIITI